MDLKEILAALDGLPPAEQDKQLAAARKLVGGMRWKPNPGPQTDAFFTEADELEASGWT